MLESFCDFERLRGRTAVTAGESAKPTAKATAQSRERCKPLPEARVASRSPPHPDVRRDSRHRSCLRRALGQYTCSGSRLRPLPATGTLRCMKYRPATRLRPPLIGVAVVKAAPVGMRQGRACSHRASLAGSVGRKWRCAQCASALSIVLSAMVRPEVVGAPEGREDERLSRVTQSAKAAATGSPQSRARLYKAFL